MRDGPITHDYPQRVDLHIDGAWVEGVARRTMPIHDPATGAPMSTLSLVTDADLERALAAAQRGFMSWRQVSAHERSKVMRKAADLMRQRIERIATLMTLEQGKPLAEARIEVNFAADIVDWFAEESRRAYGRVIPARVDGVLQLVVREPVGPVAAFTPWNFPVIQSVRKVSAALAAGCSVLLKAPEETPASPAEMIRAFVDAGVPPGVLGLVYGVPAEVSAYCIPHPVIRKISFTGSTAVGKQLAGLAGLHMKRATMELGGHAPAVVFDDADVDAAVRILAANKFRNCGQVCICPTRFLVQDRVHDAFVERFVAAVEALRVGPGIDASSTLGPLANPRRVQAMERLVGDAVERGARVTTGGLRIDGPGNFYRPTVLTDVPIDAMAMNEEPFGPLALIRRFDDDEAIAEANRLPFGLAAYGYTRSTRRAQSLASRIEAGMVSINHHGVGLPETPFGGIKDSGHGSEGGSEALEGYLNTKFVTQAAGP